MNGVVTAIENAQLPEHLKIVTGSELQPRSIEWLWMNKLAKGKLHILAGQPGTGKSTIAFQFAATVSSGGNWPDGAPCPQGNAIIWTGEDDLTDTVAPRLIGMGANMDCVHLISGTVDKDGERFFDPAQDAVLLSNEIKRIGNISLLIIDPIVSAVAADSHKNGEVRRALQPLVDAGQKYKVAVLGISHFSKGTQGRDPTERVTGSLAFGALARVVMVAAKLPEDSELGEGRIFAVSKSNIGIDEGGFKYDLQQTELRDHPGVTTSIVVWGDALEGSARTLLEQADTAPLSSEKPSQQAVELLEKMLKNGSIDAKDAMKTMRQHGFTAKQVRTAREKMKVKSERVGFGSDGHFEWVLPNGYFNNSIDAHSDRQGIYAETVGTQGLKGDLTPIDAHSQENGIYGDNCIDANSEEKGSYDGKTPLKPLQDKALTIDAHHQEKGTYGDDENQEEFIL
jgi:hypothetical protein